MLLRTLREIQPPRSSADRDALSCGDSSGDTLLHVAARRDSMEMLEALIEAGATASAVNRRGSTPLHDAAAMGSPRAVEALLRAGCAADLRDSDGRTPLHYAAGSSVQGRDGSASSKRFVRTIQTLVANGCDVLTLDKQGNTALHLASAAGAVATTRLLLQLTSARVPHVESVGSVACNLDGKTALHLAGLGAGDPAVVELVREWDVVECAVGCGWKCARREIRQHEAECKGGDAL